MYHLVDQLRNSESDVIWTFRLTFNLHFQDHGLVQVEVPPGILADERLAVNVFVNEQFYL